MSEWAGINGIYSLFVVWDGWLISMRDQIRPAIDADRASLWMQGLALVLPQLSPEFGVSTTRVRYTTMITYIGLAFGSTFWGLASDIIGRRLAFNVTLFLCGMFGASVSLGPSWIVTSILFACMGLGG
jgi:MFS family permease